MPWVCPETASEDRSVTLDPHSEVWENMAPDVENRVKREDPGMTDSPEYLSKLNTNVPHSARVWNYWLGGKDNFAADRAVGDKVREVYPDVVAVARASRAFLARAVRYLAGEAGIRQFLDLGTGLPTANNTHEVAQAVAPDARVVYVDNDPLVLVHARALLTSSAEGRTDYIDADVRDSEAILVGAAKTLDFSRPVALMMLGILGNVPDEDGPETIVDRFVAAVPSGSFLVINDSTKTADVVAEAVRTAGDAGVDYHLRTPDRIAGFFAGLDLIEPGVVSTPLWRPEPDPAGPPAALNVFCGVGRKP
jgi:S-adenosyl methyltransferase